MEDIGGKRQMGRESVTLGGWESLGVERGDWLAVNFMPRLPLCRRDSSQNKQPFGYHVSLPLIIPNFNNAHHIHHIHHNPPPTTEGNADRSLRLNAELKAAWERSPQGM